MQQPLGLFANPARKGSYSVEKLLSRLKKPIEGVENAH
jgi:hypothetical protein